MITTNLTLTNGATSEVPIRVTGITFEVDSKLAVNPSVVFPLDVAIDSSEIVGIDFDETLHTGDYTESITINTLGGRHDIVHSVTIDDTTPEVCDDGLLDNGCFDTADGWTLGAGASIDAGELHFLDIATGSNGAYCSSNVIDGDVTISFDVTNYVSGEFTAWFGGSQTVNDNPRITSNGTHTFDTSADGSNGLLILGSYNVGTCTIDNVKLVAKESDSVDEKIAEFEAMKAEIIANKLLNTPLVGITTTYYVDSVSGLDTNDGLTELTAFQTARYALETEADYTPNSAVLFKRGQEFQSAGIYGQDIIVDLSLTNCVIGAYGDEGIAQPIIHSVQAVAGVWTEMEPNIWHSENAGETGRLWRNGIELRLSYDPALEVLGDTWQWYEDDDTNTLMVYSETDLNLDLVEKSWTDYQLNIDGMTDLIIQDIDIRSGIYSLFIANSHRIDIENVTFGGGGGNGSYVRDSSYVKTNNSICDSLWRVDYSMGTPLEPTYSNGTSSRGTNDGIGLFNNTEYCEITNTFSQDWGHANISISISDGSYGRYHTVQNNYVAAPSVSYGGRLSGSGTDFHNCLIDNNYIVDTAVRHQMQGRDNVWSNIIVSNVINSPLKGVNVGQGFAVQNYNGEVHGNIYQNFIIMGTDSFGFWLPYDERNSIYDNDFINIQCYDYCRQSDAYDTGLYVADNDTINPFNRYTGCNSYKDANITPYVVRDGVGNVEMTAEEFNASDVNRTDNTSVPIEEAI